MKELTAGEQNQLMGGDFSISTDQCDVTEGLDASDGLEGGADVGVELRVREVETLSHLCLTLTDYVRAQGDII